MFVKKCVARLRSGVRGRKRRRRRSKRRTQLRKAGGETGRGRQVRKRRR